MFHQEPATYSMLARTSMFVCVCACVYIVYIYICMFICSTEACRIFNACEGFSVCVCVCVWTSCTYIYVHIYTRTHTHTQGLRV